MLVLRKKVNEKSFTKVNIENTLKSLQSEVGGYIEVYGHGLLGNRGLVMILNEDGKMLGLKENLVLTADGKPYDIVVGDVLVAKVSGDDFTGLNEGDIKYFNTLVGSNIMGIPSIMVK